MSAVLTGLEEATVNITSETRVAASPATTFAALVEQLGASNEHPDGTPMPLKLELWPGGRWYRDLGDNEGHFWAHVQAIKQNVLLEFCGPLFMSAPVANNVQYRLSEEDGETVIKFRHSAFGMVPEELRANMTKGWGHIHEQAKLRAEGLRK
jgi:uncharacterized protein YndB with AHSA1/START domain